MEPSGPSNDKIDSIFSSILKGKDRDDPALVQGALSALVGAMSSIAKNKAALEEECKKLKSRVQELTTQLETQEEKEEEIRTLRKDNIKLQAITVEKADQIRSLEARLAKRDKEFDELQARLAKRDAIKKEIKTDQCYVEGHISLGEKYSELETQLSAALAENTTLEEAKKRRKDRNKSLKEENRVLDSARNNAVAEVQKLKEENSVCTVKLRAQVAKGEALRRRYEEEQARRKGLENSSNKRLKFYQTTTFNRYLRNLASPAYPDVVRDIGPRDMNLDAFSGLHSLPFFTLDDRQLKFKGLHALAYCTSLQHEEVAGEKWYPCDVFQNTAGKEVELFVKERTRLKYVGVFRCHSTEDWVDSGASKPDDIPAIELLRASQAVHSGSELRIADGRLQNAYSRGSLKVDTLVLECCGFNAALYNILEASGRHITAQIQAEKRKASEGDKEEMTGRKQVDNKRRRQ